MEHALFLTEGQDGLSVKKTDDGRVQIDTTFRGTRLRTLMTDMESEEVCELLWRATLEARDAKELGGE